MQEVLFLNPCKKFKDNRSRSMDMWVDEKENRSMLFTRTFAGMP